MSTEQPKPPKPTLIGSDHLGLALKEHLKQHLEAKGHEVRDLGCWQGEEVDYPDVASNLATHIAHGDASHGILVCGTGLGMAIAANKVPGVRAASVTDAYSAERAKKSNNAQVLCLGALVVGDALAALLVDAWLDAEFAGGRSAAKVAKIDALDHSAEVC